MSRLEFLDVPQLGARYLNIPKTGSGSIRMQAYRQLCDLAGKRLDKSVLWDNTIWVRRSNLSRLAPRFSFAFSRDPYQRIAAVYRHKIVHPQKKGKRVSSLFAIYGIGFPMVCGKSSLFCC